MKGTENFKNVIKEYLDERARTDEQFAMSYAKENKNLEECCKYIFSEVKKSGMTGFADEEIFGMAVHYYDEDSIGDIENVSCDVVVNHHIDLTEEEKAEARQKAIEQYQQSCIAEEKRKAKERAEKEEARRQAQLEEMKEQEKNQPSLFEL